MNTDRSHPSQTEWIAFGPFVLHLRQRLLTRDGASIPLNPRALELLIALLERPGQILTKDELIERIWRDRTVAEINLRVAVAALRKGLAATDGGEAYIVNSAGRGYAFSREVRLEHWPPRTDEHPNSSTGAPPALQGLLPSLLKPVIGREDATEWIVEHLEQGRLVTVVGPAGIGKTTVAISTASRPFGTHAEVRFVDFAPARDPGLVPARIAASLTLDQVGGDPLQVAIDTAADKRMLLILDNCEHVLDAVAEATTAILEKAPRVRIIATSREPLHIEGETVFRLGGLTYPPAASEGTAQEMLRYAAVRLLVERVQAVSREFDLTDNLAKPAAEICRRLDGIALAIQLAAGRVSTLGLFEVASRLDDRFRFLGHGSRTALPRHRTLDAAIGWSFELLDADERLVCARLSIFSGDFSLDAAVEVAGWAPISREETAGIIASLVEKSLIVFVADPARPHYLFLETIRDFARARLHAIDPVDTLLGKLARCLICDRNHFDELIRAGETASATAFARRRMDDLRYAVGRAFEIGDTGLLSELLVKFAPLMFHLGAIFELADWSRQALDTVTSPRERLPLLMPYARALGLSRPDLTAQVALFAEAVDIAQSLGDQDSELRARWGLSYLSGVGYTPRQCLKAGLAFQDRARALDDRSAIFAAETLRGWALHDLGEYGPSMEAHRRVVDGYSPEASAADANRFGLNHRAISMCDLSEGYWQIGDLDEAEAWNQASIREAGDHLPTLFIPLSQRLCRTLYASTDWADITGQFDELNRRFNVDGRWKSWIRTLGAIIDAHRHPTPATFSRLDPDILSGQWNGLTNRYIWIVVPFVQCCLIHGKQALALKLADQLVSTLRATECLWVMPEALRLKAVALADVDPEAAVPCFGEARACAATLGAINFARYIEASCDALRPATEP